MKRTALFLILLITGFSVSAQKVKYKDLYVLLRAKNYGDGAKFLIKFLADNPEHPNANYQMGLMLEHKIAELDILKQSDRVVERADSAITYFDKAYTFITPKDVKKHDDDYYELFKRRNLRTGKFEVILSDVQLDIDNRKQALSNKKKNVAVINTAFNKAVIYYDSAINRYKIIKEAYKDAVSLSLGASDSTIASINSLVIEYDSSVLYFKKYKKLKKEFNPTTEDLLINIKPMSGFEDMGLTSIDFYSRKVNFLDFNSWGKEQLGEIEKQHQLIENLITYDKSLTLMAERISTDSVSLRSEIFSKYTDPTLKSLKSIDEESFIFKLVNYKLGQLNLASGLMDWYMDYKDTIDVGVQLKFIENLRIELDGVKKLESLIESPLDDQFWLRYSYFVNRRYQSKEQFIGMMDSQKGLLENQEKSIASKDSLVRVKDSNGYINGESIPLLWDGDSLTKYHTFYLDSIDNRVFEMVGLVRTDSSYQYYFATVPSSRQIDSLFTVETKFTNQDVGKESYIVSKESALESSVLYLMGDSTSHNYDLIHFSRSNGVLWQNKLDQIFSTTPTLSYSQGQIELSSEEVTKKISLEDGRILE